MLKNISFPFCRNKIYILIAFLIKGMILYAVVEFIHKKKTKNLQMQK